MKRLLSSQMIASCTCRQQSLCSSPQISQRFFASRRKTRANKPKKQPSASPKKPRSQKLPSGVFLPEAADSVPPLYLSATGSPWVYVATCAVDEAEMNAKWLFCNDEPPPPVFHASYVSPKVMKHELPKWNIPEVAFLGRSNVGKSSLVNALLKQNLAYCSKQPGRTQQVNYFGMYSTSTIKSPSEAVGFLVDLPGYGFAAAPPDQVQAWQERTQTFLQHRRDATVLKRLFLLVDARRGSSQIDRDIMGWMDDAMIPYSIVLTKADRVGRPQLVRYCNDVCMRHHSQVYGEHGGMQGPVVHMTSSRDGHGIKELLTSIHAEFAGYREEATVMREGWSEESNDKDDDEEDSFDPDNMQK